MPLPPRYRYQSLTEAQHAAIRAALDAGVRAQDLSREYGVSVRTIHRIREQGPEPVVAVAAGAWTTRFALTDSGPVQVEPWRPTAEALA